MAVSGPVTRGKTKQQNKSHQIHIQLQDDVFQSWRHLADKEGLETDTEVAAFLLQSYDLNPSVTGLNHPECESCQSALILVCPRCKPTASPLSPKQPQRSGITPSQLFLTFQPALLSSQQDGTASDELENDDGAERERESASSPSQLSLSLQPALLFSQQNETASAASVSLRSSHMTSNTSEHGFRPHIGILPPVSGLAQKSTSLSTPVLSTSAQKYSSSSSDSHSQARLQDIISALSSDCGTLPSPGAGTELESKTSEKVEPFDVSPSSPNGQTFSSGSRELSIVSLEKVELNAASPLSHSGELLSVSSPACRPVSQSPSAAQEEPMSSAGNGDSPLTNRINSPPSPANNVSPISPADHSSPLPPADHSLLSPADNESPLSPAGNDSLLCQVLFQSPPSQAKKESPPSPADGDFMSSPAQHSQSPSLPVSPSLQEVPESLWQSESESDSEYLSPKPLRSGLPFVSIFVSQSPATGEVTRASTREVTRASTGEVTRASTGEVTRASTGEVTRASTGEVTRASTGEVTRASTGEVTRASTGEVTRASTGEVSRASTGEVRRTVGDERSSTPGDESLGDTANPVSASPVRSTPFLVSGTLIRSAHYVVAFNARKRLRNHLKARRDNNSSRQECSAHEQSSAEKKSRPSGSSPPSARTAVRRMPKKRASQLLSRPDIDGDTDADPFPDEPDPDCLLQQTEAEGNTQSKSEYCENDGGSASGQLLANARKPQLVSQSQMKTNPRKHRNPNRYACPKCYRCFPFRGMLTQHMATHNVKRPNRCTQCGASFTTKVNLREHMDAAHPTPKTYKCTLCSASFAKPNGLTFHLRRAHNGAMFSCGECGRQFRRLTQIKQHQLSAHTERERPHVCELCNKGFYHKGGLSDHMRRHTNTRPFLCQTCGAAFVDKGTLKGHINQKHSDYRPFKCPLCPKVFLRRSMLRAHSQKHSQEKTFQCEQCGQAFGYRSTLKRHERAWCPYRLM
ncbi:uncharacterized protein [Littorina saxatilis]|uniref:C2H2-type domain-containing protein n=1 Tax=Littorina saxatilis TaxID=31220 RepID=A0AAN9B131_9CAEN